MIFVNSSMKDGSRQSQSRELPEFVLVLVSNKSVRDDVRDMVREPVQQTLVILERTVG
jgi:hypothetical protein